MAKFAWIEGYEGKYQITDEGQVLSYAHNNPKVLSLYPCGQGYLRVVLWNTSRVKKYIHQLVARNFVDGFKPGLQVNHKNGIKTDNRAENLEWVTMEENLRHAIKTGLINARPVKGTHIETGEVVFFEHSADAARKLCGSEVYIRAICNGIKNYKTHKNYRWSYA